jgi:hypothetical protein
VSEGELEVLSGLGLEIVLAAYIVVVVERVVRRSDDAAAGERLRASVRVNIKFKSFVDDAAVTVEHDAVSIVDADVIIQSAGPHGLSLVFAVLCGLSSLSAVLIPGSAEWPISSFAISIVDPHSVVLAAGSPILEGEHSGGEFDEVAVGHVDRPDAVHVVVVVAVLVKAGRLDGLRGGDGASAVVDDGVYISVDGGIFLLGKGNSDHGGGELENGVF